MNTITWGSRLEFVSEHHNVKDKAPDLSAELESCFPLCQHMTCSKAHTVSHLGPQLPALQGVDVSLMMCASPSCFVML